MINDKNDLNKTRYTHRDYESIRADLINAIPSLTQEWTNREESDPGIVLIKLMAMFGDTLSYNIDKIALELYLASVTQRKNCAKIFELIGYKTHWYRSGRVMAYVRLVSDYDDDGNRNHTILVPYQTYFTAGNIRYTVVGDNEYDIYSSTAAIPVELVEGIAVTTTFKANSLIDNKYYFGQSNIDESNIKLLVNGSNLITCKLIDRLYLASSSNVIYYEFNVDEYDRPYIQLSDNWQDIANSDEVEFTLTYLVSSGSAGNVSSNAFTAMYSTKAGYASNTIITNLPNTTNYYRDGVNLDTYNSPGYDPQSVEEAKKDGYNYTFTHDTLVSSSDYEKACRRINNITISKLVDAQVIINDGLNLDDISSRALDDFPKVTVEEPDPEDPSSTIDVEYLAPYQVILYLAYKNFDKEANYYFSSPAAMNTPWSLYQNYNDPYDSPYNEMKSGYYPYRPNDNILQMVREYISGLQLVCDKVDFGTMKLFPFKVQGTLHLVEPISPSETLQVVEAVDTALEEAYYPDLHPIGEKPNFIELVDIIQNSDLRIRYFDAIGNIVEWAPPVQSLSDYSGDLVYTKLVENSASLEVPDHPSSITDVYKDGVKLVSGTDYTYNNSTHTVQFTVTVLSSYIEVHYNRSALSDADLYFDDVFDTTSAIMYNGLSSKFNLAKKFLKFKFKNVGVTVSSSDYPADYGTAYLVNYSAASGTLPVITVGPRSTYTVQCESVKELEALCEDIKFKGNVLIPYLRTMDGSPVTESFVFGGLQTQLDQDNVYTSSMTLPASVLITSLTWSATDGTPLLNYVEFDDGSIYINDDPSSGSLNTNMLNQVNLNSDNDRIVTVAITLNNSTVVPECELTYDGYSDSLYDGHGDPIYKSVAIDNTGLQWVEE